MKPWPKRNQPNRLPPRWSHTRLPNVPWFSQAEFNFEQKDLHGPGLKVKWLAVRFYVFWLASWTHRHSQTFTDIHRHSQMWLEPFPFVLENEAGVASFPCMWKLRERYSICKGFQLAGVFTSGEPDSATWLLLPHLTGKGSRFGIRRVHRFGLHLVHRFGIPQHQHQHHHPHHRRRRRHQQ